MPELKQVALADIDEPPLPARMAMDDEKLNALAQNMAAIGLLSPICLKANDLRYEIEAGHRRFVAARLLGWRDIRALVYQPGELAEGAAMLAENIYREDLSAAEEAILFEQTREKYNLDEAGLCARFHVTPDYLGDRMRLLRDDKDVFAALLARKITFTVARELNKCKYDDDRRYLLDIAIRTEYGGRVIADQRRQLEAQHMGTQVAQPPEQPATDVPQAEPYRLECAICGGHKDPFNLVIVHIHKWEWEQILEKLLAAQQEES